MAIQIAISISGDKEVQAKIKRLGRNLTRFKAAMKLIGEESTKYFANQAFDSRGGVFGEKWKSLSPKYQEWKKNNFPGRPPLVLYGDMQDGFVYEATDSGVIVTNTADYFKYHQSSLPRSSNLPRRKMIGVNSKVRKIVKDVITEDVRQKLRNA